ncbi:uncharacterized protein LOC131940771 [Physella acuta]|uniref:uncharacterized protein LOC131940771 n=1 Tax=Physella acuta TaxID=109671 RepID=UPI0027DC7A14|nr:uncharacterized protein LOC131940771 [Physella acuta]XP_059155555.1 uncharacterized protein LOC131940771 [Physella acuta]
MDDRMDLYKLKNTEEVELMEGEHWSDNLAHCHKNDRHREFMTLSTFKEKSLGDIHRDFKFTEDEREIVLILANLTGRIKIGKRYGTGCLQKLRINKDLNCPIEKCAKKHEQHKSATLTVTTVFHVVPNKDDLKELLFQFFYDEDYHEDDFKLNVENAFGLRLGDTEKEGGSSDWCFIECVTHNMELVGKLEEQIAKFSKLQTKLFKKYKDQDPKPVIIVSHPHSGPKKISVGKTEVSKNVKEVRENQRWCQYYYDTPTCPGSSGSYVLILGQPLNGSGYWFGHPHNHSGESRKGGINCSSVGVDHVG